MNFFSNQVAVTGLARFDELFNPNVEVKNQILIIPTWRDWLTSIDRLQTSEYLKRMNDLLHSQKLKEIANKGTDIIFVYTLICNLLLIILMCQTMLRVLSKGYRCSEIDKRK